MIHDFEDANRILAEMVENNMVEPIDDPSLDVNYWDWAEVVGIVDELVPNEPFWANAF